MARIKKADNRSIAKFGCASMHQVNSKYVWTCDSNGTIIITLPALKTTAKNYEEESAKRLKMTTEAINAHRH